MELEAYLRTQAAGMGIVAGAAGMSHAQLTAAGATDHEARELRALAETYFGNTAFTRKQRIARQSAQPLSALKLIESFARRAATQRAAWALREKLLPLRSTTEIEALARTELRAAKKKPAHGVKIYRRPAAWTLAITGPSALIADLYAAIDTATPEAALKSVEDAFFGHSSAGRTRKITNVVVPLDKFVRIQQGDTDVTLQMTNGATMTGTEFLDTALEGYVTLLHPVEGPVNLYYGSRSPSLKQTIMAKAESPVCARPGCYHPADYSQIHHIDAWAHGGPTNQKNLAVLCARDNGLNDDNPNAPPRGGHLERVEGGFTWSYRPRHTPAS